MTPTNTFAKLFGSVSTLAVVGGAMALNGVAMGQAGAVAAWGLNDSGQCDIPSDLGKCIEISASRYYTIAIQENGFVKTWGSAPTVPPDLKFKAIAAGHSHVLLIHADGSLRAYGDNSDNKSTIPTGVGTCTNIAASKYNSAAIQTTGSLKIWGLATWGLNTLPTSLGSCIQVAMGDNHALALTVNGIVKGWGNYNTYGQSIVPSTLGVCTAVAAGTFNSVALQSNGTVVVWGNSGNGMANIPSDAVNCIQIATGGSHNAAISSEKLFVWGNNLQGQCSLPTNLGVCSKIAVGGNHTVVIQTPRTTITGVLPISGSSSGGTNITITGTQFEAAATVTIGGAPATNVVVVSDSQITATTPAGFPGPAVVTVNLGSSTAFYYRPSCGSDLDNNGVVDSADLGIVLLDFGNCYESAAPQEEQPLIMQTVAPAKSVPNKK